MNIAVIVDSFPPIKTSAAIQMFILCQELRNIGHKLVIFTPDSQIVSNFDVSEMAGFEVVRIRVAKVGKSNLSRLFHEIILSAKFYFALRKTQYMSRKWHGIIWYSPTIFFGPFVKILKLKSGAKTYLIIRDIFPEWAFDLGIIKSRIVFNLLKFCAEFQYSVADIIGIQSPGNAKYFKKKYSEKVEVLNNWFGPIEKRECTLDLHSHNQHNKKLLVYSGNVGIAQSLDWILDLCRNEKFSKNYSVLIVGRGSEVKRLKECVARKYIDNVYFYDEIEPGELPDLYSKCLAGIVSLDERHLSHNIPGKFVNYVFCGLPVIAKLNQGNDLIQVIEKYRVGYAFTKQHTDIDTEIITFLERLTDDSFARDRCNQAANELFSVKKISEQIAEKFSYNLKV